MTGLGLGAVQKPGEIQVKFRAGWLRSVAITMGSASILGLGIGLLNLAQREPVQLFELLSRWGFVWLLALAAMVLVWDLAKIALGYIGRLADSVQETAVAMGRIADRDDRDRDRMITETAFIGQRLERLSDELRNDREERREGNKRMEELIRAMTKG